VTNGNGVATAPTLTANGTAGSYTVTASVSGVSTPASFNLSNTSVPVGGSLSGSVTTASTAVNLTTEGTADWIHWGTGGVDRKAAGGSQISNVAVVGTGPFLTYTDDPRLISWTGGTPTATSTNNPSGFYILGIGNGLTFTAPADTSVRTLIVHVGGFHSGGILTAHLSDGSAADYTNTSSILNARYDRNYTLTYRASGPGQTLRVTWTMVSGNGNNRNVNISAAALSGP
jgi:hypothetical protein